MQPFFFNLPISQISFHSPPSHSPSLLELITSLSELMRVSKSIVSISLLYSIVVTLGLNFLSRDLSTFLIIFDYLMSSPRLLIAFTKLVSLVLNLEIFSPSFILNASNCEVHI